MKIALVQCRQQGYQVKIFSAHDFVFVSPDVPKSSTPADHGASGEI